MNGKEKRISDDAFAAKVLAESAARPDDGFTAAERAAARELFSLIGPIRLIVADYQFRGEAWKRMANTGTLVKAWITWVTAAAGLVTLLAAAAKYLSTK